MRLVDLNPSFYSMGGAGITSSATGEPIPERKGMGIVFDCPCGCGTICAVPFANPLDGGPAQEKGWQRTGDTFEALTLHPSIQRVGGCAWHGWIQNGVVSTA